MNSRFLPRSSGDARGGRTRAGLGLLAGCLIGLSSIGFAGAAQPRSEPGTVAPAQETPRPEIENPAAQPRSEPGTVASAQETPRPENENPAAQPRSEPGTVVPAQETPRPEIENPAAVPSPSFTSPRKALKAAREALAAGKHLEALRDYEMALEGTRGGRASAARAEALFGAGMLLLWQDAVTPDTDRGVKLLREFLELFPEHSYSAGPRVVIDLVQEEAVTRAELERLKEDLSRTQAAHREDHQALEASLQAARAEADSRRDQMKGQVERCDGFEKQLAVQAGELALLREDVARKDEEIKRKNDALRRLKKALTEPRTPITPGTGR